MKPLVSVIIPFYKNVIWLEEAIKSVLEQTYDNIEILLINDGSAEDISEILNNYGYKINYIYQENSGAASARNKGINNSKGEYISFLDSDDIWCSDKVELQVKYMIENNLMWSHTSYERFNSEKVINKVDVAKYIGCVFPICIVSSPIATPCVMIKSEVLKDDNNLRFCEVMESGEDTYLWMKLALKYELGSIEKALTKVRIRGYNAALLAYCQLRYRYQIWQVLNSELKDYVQKLNGVTKLGFKICSFNYKMLNSLPNVIKKNKNCVEIISKFLYIVPWTMFKTQRIKYLKGE